MTGFAELRVLNSKWKSYLQVRTRKMSETEEQQENLPKKVLDKHRAVCDTEAGRETVNPAFTTGTLTTEEWKAEMELGASKTPVLVNSVMIGER